MIEEFEAYRLSDGQIMFDRAMAEARQKALDDTKKVEVGKLWQSRPQNKEKNEA